MPPRSRSPQYPKVLNTRIGRRMVRSLPGFFLKTPDSNISVTISMLGGMTSQLRDSVSIKSREAFAGQHLFNEAPYTVTKVFDQPDFDEMTHESHLLMPDESEFLHAPAIGMSSRFKESGIFPVLVTSPNAHKMYFYTENVGGVFKRRLGILDTSGDLYTCDMSNDAKRVTELGLLGTTTDHPYYEMFTSATTPTLLLGDGSVPEEEDGIADWVTEYVYAQEEGGFFLLDHIPLPLTMTVWDKNGQVVSSGSYTLSNNRITTSASIDLPIRVKYVRRSIYDSNSVVLTSGTGLSLMDAADIQVVSVTYANAHQKPGQIIQLEVFSPYAPDIHTTEVTYTKGGTVVFTPDSNPGLESPYTDTMLSIEPGSLRGSYIITLHSALAIGAWKANSADPAVTSDFSVKNTELAFNGMARDNDTGDLYVLKDNKLSIWESHPFHQKEIILKTGNAEFGGTQVFAPDHTKWVYVDGEQYVVTSNTLTDTPGNLVSLPDGSYNYAYVTDDFDMNTLMGETLYTFQSLCIYQDSLIVLATQPGLDRTVLFFDLDTLEYLGEMAASSMVLTGQFSKGGQTFNQTNLKSITVTDYGTVLAMWNKNSVTVITEHFLTYDVCHYDTVSQTLHFKFPTFDDFDYTAHPSAGTSVLKKVLRSDLNWQVLQHMIDRKAAIYTALKDPDRESMRERPHWSSGFTLLDFTNSFLMRISNREDTSLQGMINVFSRLTGNEAYDINPKLMSMTIPDHDSVTAVTLVKGITNTVIAAQSETSVTGTGSSTAVVSTMLTEFTVDSAGWLMEARLPEVDWTDKDCGVFRAVLLEAFGGTFRATDVPLMGLIVNGGVVIVPTGSAYLTAGTYAVSISSDYENAFTGTVYSSIGGTTIEGSVPLNGLSDALTGAPELRYHFLSELQQYDPDTVIGGGSVRYFATDRSVVFNLSIPSDHEILLDYVTSRHNVTTASRVARLAGNVASRVRPTNYVEVTLGA